VNQKQEGLKTHQFIAREEVGKLGGVGQGVGQLAIALSQVLFPLMQDLRNLAGGVSTCQEGSLRGSAGFDQELQTLLDLTQKKVANERNVVLSSSDCKPGRRKRKKKTKGRINELKEEFVRMQTCFLSKLQYSVDICRGKIQEQKPLEILCLLQGCGGQVELKHTGN